MAVLLSLFNTVSARDGLLDIEVSPNHIEEDEQNVTEMGGDIVERGDILNIETTAQPAQQMEMKRELLDMKLPAKGMSKSKVEATFGSPIEIRPAVGEPPISSWAYDSYTVYFEHDWVIHSVLNRKK